MEGERVISQSSPEPPAASSVSFIVVDDEMTC
jgi:hypothetical protein